MERCADLLLCASVWHFSPSFAGYRIREGQESDKGVIPKNREKFPFSGQGFVEGWLAGMPDGPRLQRSAAR
jgi:hypothetical protein